MKILKYILVIPTFIAVHLLLSLVIGFLINSYINNLFEETILNWGESVIKFFKETEFIYNIKWFIVTYLATLITFAIFNNLNIKITIFVMASVLLILISLNFYLYFTYPDKLDNHTNTITKLIVICLSNILGFVLVSRKIYHAQEY